MDREQGGQEAQQPSEAKKGRKRRRWTKYDPRTVAKVLRQSHGMIYVAARRLGCSHQTIYNYAKRFRGVQRAIEEARGLVLDTAELKLYEAVREGEPWAIRFLLERLGKDRGYAERKELRLTDAELDRVIERELQELENSVAEQEDFGSVDDEGWGMLHEPGEEVEGSAGTD